jgi:hypothetical protein
MLRARERNEARNEKERESVRMDSFGPTLISCNLNFLFVKECYLHLPSSPVFIAPRLSYLGLSTLSSADCNHSLHCSDDTTDVPFGLIYCEGASSSTTTRGEERPKEKEWERVLDCLSLGLCQLFECFTPH